MCSCGFEINQLDWNCVFISLLSFGRTESSIISNVLTSLFDPTPAATCYVDIYLRIICSYDVIPFDKWGKLRSIFNFRC